MKKETIYKNILKGIMKERDDNPERFGVTVDVLVVIPWLTTKRRFFNNTAKEIKEILLETYPNGDLYNIQLGKGFRKTMLGINFIYDVSEYKEP